MKFCVTIAFYKMFFYLESSDTLLLFRIDSFLPIEIKVNVKSKNKTKEIVSSTVAELAPIKILIPNNIVIDKKSKYFMYLKLEE